MFVCLSVCSGRHHLEWMSGPHGGRFAGSFMMTVSQDDEPETISSMAQRLSRVHGIRVTGPRHHSNQSQSLHLSPPQGVTQPPLPAVVQNLLGPESSSDGIQFSSSTSLERKLACENIRFSSLFVAWDVSRGGTSATQRQKFHTDDVKSVQNPVRSADWSTE